MNLSKRQREILEIIKNKQPIRSSDISEMINVSLATVRSDLSILVALGAVDAKPNVGYFYREHGMKSDFYEEMEAISVHDAMSPPVAIEESRSVYDGTVKMILEDCGTLFVTKDDLLVGVVSRKDLLRSTLQTSDLKDLPIGVIMTRMPLVVCHENDSIAKVASLIDQHQIDSLPVIKEVSDGVKVIGRISKTGITRKIVELINT